MVWNTPRTSQDIPYASKDVIEREVKGNLDYLKGVVDTNVTGIATNITGIAANAGKLAAYQRATKTSNFVITTSGWKDITDLSVSVTLETGDFVLLFLQIPEWIGTTGNRMDFRILRDSTVIQYVSQFPSAANVESTVNINTLDVPSGGTYTYKAQALGSQFAGTYTLYAGATGPLELVAILFGS